MAKLFECNGLELAEWARKRVEDEDPLDFAQGRLDEDEDDEDALCWLLPTASCRLPTLVAAEGRDGFTGGSALSSLPRGSPFFAVLRPLSSVLCPLPSVLCPPSTVLWPLLALWRGAGGQWSRWR